MENIESITLFKLFIKIEVRDYILYKNTIPSNFFDRKKNTNLPQHFRNKRLHSMGSLNIPMRLCIQSKLDTIRVLYDVHFQKGYNFVARNLIL